MKILIFLSCLIISACGNYSETIKIPEPGENNKSVNLKNIEGEMVSPEDYFKVQIIAWGNKYNSKGYPIIGIPKSAGPFFRRHF